MGTVSWIIWVGPKESQELLKADFPCLVAECEVRETANTKGMKGLDTCLLA